MSELLASFELFDDGSVVVHMRDRRYDVDTLVGVATAAAAARDVTWAATEEDPTEHAEVAQEAEPTTAAEARASAHQAEDGGSSPPLRSIDPPSGGEVHPKPAPKPWVPTLSGVIPPPVTIHAKESWGCSRCDFVGASRQALAVHCGRTGHDKPAPLPGRPIGRRSDLARVAPGGGLKVSRAG